nr:protein BIG GRAIN 1-like B [Coffea arabica]
MDNHHKYCYRKERENSSPSFSSTLLDAIYRSIDETEHPQEGQDELVLYKETMRKKHSSNLSNFRADHAGFKDEIDMANFQRACLIEKWMEKKVVVRRKSAADFERKSRNEDAAAFFNSSSSSSDSSSGGGFSSSEAESVYGASARSSSCYGYGLHKPKPIRTSVSAHQPEKLNKRNKDFNCNMYEDGGHNHQPKPKQEGGAFVKTKSRALKIYGDLKKVKQPISPGGRLASFLNSIFTAGNAKKAKISSSNNIGIGVYDDATSERKVKSANASTCSSASSFSRSCLSKTPSCRGKSSNGMKRSVRFCPVSVIVDEDCQPCGQKSLYDDKPSMDLEAVKNSIRSSIAEELKFHVMEKNRKVEEAARDLLRNFQKKVEREQFDRRNAGIESQAFDHHVVDDEDEEEDDDLDDDAASYASSDLFELDNLSAIGMERYREELPVYETTNLGTNRAIASGLIL